MVARGCHTRIFPRACLPELHENIHSWPLDGDPSELDASQGTCSSRLAADCEGLPPVRDLCGVILLRGIQCACTPSVGEPCVCHEPGPQYFSLLQTNHTIGASASALALLANLSKLEICCANCLISMLEHLLPEDIDRIKKIRLVLNLQYLLGSADLKIGQMAVDAVQFFRLAVAEVLKQCSVAET